MSEAIIRGWRTLDLLSSFPQIPEKKQSFSLCLNLSFLSCFASSRGDSVGGDVDVVGGREGVGVGVGGGVVLGSVEVEKSRLKSHPLPLVKQSLRKSAAVSGAVTPLGLAVVVVVVVIVDSVELT